MVNVMATCRASSSLELDGGQPTVHDAGKEDEKQDETRRSVGPGINDMWEDSIACVMDKPRARNLHVLPQTLAFAGLDAV